MVDLQPRERWPTMRPGADASRRWPRENECMRVPLLRPRLREVAGRAFQGIGGTSISIVIRGVVGYLVRVLNQFCVPEQKQKATKP